jgi:preprotein translocase subunit YajC
MLNTLLNWAFGLKTALAAATDTAAAADPGTTTAAASDPTGGLISMLLPMALIFVVFYFMLIRPQRKKDKKVKDMLSNLKVSDRICTIGGIYGTIVSIKDDTFTVSVGQDNVKLVFARWAIRNVEEVSVENDSEVLA